MLRVGEVPKEWRKSMMRTIYKGKGDINDPNAYRGVALEPTAMKLLTRIVNEKITNQLEPHLSEAQFGFRKGQSTRGVVENLLQDIKETIEKEKGKLYVIFITTQKHLTWSENY